MQFSLPSWSDTMQLLQVSHAVLLQRAPNEISSAVKHAAESIQQNRHALRQRLFVDQPAMVLLEASGMVADLVNIVAQYANSDFDEQPYVSIYKQQQ